MLRKKFQLGPVQNLGLVDRLVRIAIGVAAMIVVAVDLTAGAGFGWHGYVILVAIYPLMTAMLGWDPLYARWGVKTCQGSGRNQCGTLPYEIDAALGHNPVPDEGYEYDHSLDSSRHGKNR